MVSFCIEKLSNLLQLQYLNSCIDQTSIYGAFFCDEGKKY